MRKTTHVFFGNMLPSNIYCIMHIYIHASIISFNIFFKTDPIPVRKMALTENPKASTRRINAGSWLGQRYMWRTHVMAIRSIYLIYIIINHVCFKKQLFTNIAKLYHITKTIERYMHCYHPYNFNTIDRVQCILQPNLWTVLRREVSVGVGLEFPQQAADCPSLVVIAFISNPKLGQCIESSNLLDDPV